MKKRYLEAPQRQPGRESVDNSPLEVSQYKSFNYSFRSNTKPSPYSEKGGGSLASTEQADFECDTQLDDQSV